LIFFFPVELVKFMFARRQPPPIFQHPLGPGMYDKVSFSVTPAPPQTFIMCQNFVSPPFSNQLSLHRIFFLARKPFCAPLVSFHAPFQRAPRVWDGVSVSLFPARLSFLHPAPDPTNAPRPALFCPKGRVRCFGPLDSSDFSRTPLRQRQSPVFLY